MSALTLSQVVEGALLAAGARRLSDNTIREYPTIIASGSPSIDRSIAFASITGPTEPLHGRTVRSIRQKLPAMSAFRSCPSTAGPSRSAWSRPTSPASWNPIKAESRAIHPFTRTDVQAMLYAVEKSKPYIRPGKASCSHTTRQGREIRPLFTCSSTPACVPPNSAISSFAMPTKKTSPQSLRQRFKRAHRPVSSSTALHLWRYLATRPDAVPDDALFATATIDRSTTTTYTTPFNSSAIAPASSMCTPIASAIPSHKLPPQTAETSTPSRDPRPRQPENVPALSRTRPGDVEANYRPASPVKNWGL